MDGHEHLLPREAREMLTHVLANAHRRRVDKYRLWWMALLALAAVCVAALWLRPVTASGSLGRDERLRAAAREELARQTDAEREFTWNRQRLGLPSGLRVSTTTR